MNDMLMDTYGRVITSLRVSITQKCSLKCIYCHEEGEERNPEREISLDTIVKTVMMATEFGIKKVKFSGEEPLMRKDFEERNAAKARGPYYKNIIKHNMCKI